MVGNWAQDFVDNRNNNEQDEDLDPAVRRPRKKSTKAKQLEDEEKERQEAHESRLLKKQPQYKDGPPMGARHADQQARGASLHAACSSPSLQAKKSSSQKGRVMLPRRRSEAGPVGILSRLHTLSVLIITHTIMDMLPSMPPTSHEEFEDELSMARRESQRPDDIPNSSSSRGRKWYRTPPELDDDDEPAPRPSNVQRRRVVDSTSPEPANMPNHTNSSCSQSAHSSRAASPPLSELNYPATSRSTSTHSSRAASPPSPPSEPNRTVSVRSQPARSLATTAPPLSKDDTPSVDLIQPKHKPYTASTLALKCYEQPVHPVFTFASSHFLALAITRGMWSDDLTYTGWGKESWRVSQKKCSSKITYDNGLLALMRKRISTTTSKLKKAISPIVDTHYGFISSSDDKIIAENKSRAQRLRTKFGMTYKQLDNLQKCLRREGMYQHPIFQQAINTAWFHDDEGTGARFLNMFKPLPIPALAMIWAVIHARIDEWDSGTHRPEDFNRHKYRDRLKDHIANLEKFAIMSQECHTDLFEKMRTTLLENACLNAGVADKLQEAQAEKSDEPSTLEDDAFHEEFRRYRELSRAASEGADGEGRGVEVEEGD
ncbi:hypothetical protein CONPUDRAFT_78035 [Coniophora puteana RWD-64-598 SS2]|uniref:DUF6532 domain-containing protein n=1 Tax=Coniophora puteana (strain RWD-64-598) TaxID=741705 RepID=R7SES0_CONPW|nr:uncharacterized protein CONPUDRAFT_78035 [Coniophora puteana RWD-64-598 SS2]EIW74365.1 hypothetical protein CONPUDRAFT_78035 [Coniophora puteana RWD-64-598 SS2]